MYEVEVVTTQKTVPGFHFSRLRRRQDQSRKRQEKAIQCTKNNNEKK